MTWQRFESLREALRARVGAMNARDRRALQLGAWIMAPVAAFVLVVQPYVRARRDAVETLATERLSLARELAALRDAPRDARLVDQGTRALAEEGARLFDGADAVAASAALAGYVSDRAAESGLELEDSETRAGADSTTVAAVEIRGGGDVLAIVGFLRALEEGPRLARIERLTIGPPPGADEGDGTLVLAATVTGLSRRATTLGAVPANGNATTTAMAAADVPSGRR